MKYRIVITLIDKGLVEASLISVFKFLWLFPIYVEEQSRTGDRDIIFDWVSFWVDLHGIPMDNIDDRTEVAA